MLWGVTNSSGSIQTAKLLYGSRFVIGMIVAYSDSGLKSELGSGRYTNEFDKSKHHEYVSGDRSQRVA